MAGVTARDPSGTTSARTARRLFGAARRHLVMLALSSGSLTGLPLAAQVVTGHLRDDSGIPTVGAVVSVLDAHGAFLRAGITRENGAFSIRVPHPGEYIVVAKRIGYRPTDSLRLSLREGETREISIALSVIPYAQPRVVVRARNECTWSPGSSGDIGTVWEDVRAALTAWQASQADGATSMRVRRFHQLRVAKSFSVSKRSETTLVGLVEAPFVSASAESLSAQGYVTPLDGNVTRYYAPDADVILSDVFVRDHCWFLVSSPSGDDVGLRFVPHRGRLVSDVEGTLWVNRNDRRLRSLDFGFTRLPDPMSDLSANGTVTFGQQPNGYWYAARWSIRMPVYEDRRGGGDRTSSPAGYVETPVIAFFEEEGGDAVPLSDSVPEDSHALARDATSASSLRTDDRVTQLTGSVRDSLTGRPIPYAEITVEDSSGAAIASHRTTEDGNFTVRDAPSNRFRLVARRLGYAQFRSELRYADDVDQSRLIIELSRTPSNVTPEVAEAAAVASNTLRVLRLNYRAIRGLVVSPGALDRARSPGSTLGDVVRRLGWPRVTVIAADSTEDGCVLADRDATRPSKDCALVVADGMIVSQMSTIEPSEIESLIFLRPSEAAAFYKGIGAGGSETRQSVRGGVLFLKMRTSHR